MKHTSLFANFGKGIKRNKNRETEAMKKKSHIMSNPLILYVF